MSSAAPAQALPAPMPLVAWRCHVALLVLLLTNFFTFAGRQVVAVLLEPIKLEFGVSDSALGLVAGVMFALLYGLLCIPAGRLADRVNRRWLIAIGMATWALATMACGWASGFWTLVLFRLLVSFSETGVTPPSFALIPDYYPLHQRNQAISIYLAGSALGSLAALAVGAWIANRYGWRAVFLSIGGPALVVSMLVAILVPEPGRATPGKAAEAKPVAPASIQRVLWRLWRQPAVHWLVLGAGLSTFIGMAYIMWLPTFLVRNHGLSLQQAGVFVAIIGTASSLIGGLSSSAVGKRLLRINPRWTLGTPIVAMAICVVASIAVFAWPSDLRVSLFGLAMPQALLWGIPVGFASAMWMPTVFTTMSIVVPADQRALGNGLLALSNTWIGFGLGPLAVGVLSDLLLPAFGSGNLRVALMITMLTGLLALYCFLRASRAPGAAH
ncbi:MAG: MFS transporter [Rhodocyclaceae bacterium]|nr:MFS transporter [Rhodocyclaceae bacterium]